MNNLISFHIIFIVILFASQNTNHSNVVEPALCIVMFTEIKTSTWQMYIFMYPHQMLLLKVDSLWQYLRIFVLIRWWWPHTFGENRVFFICRQAPWERGRFRSGLVVLWASICCMGFLFILTSWPRRPHIISFCFSLHQCFLETLDSGVAWKMTSLLCELCRSEVRQEAYHGPNSTSIIETTSKYFLWWEAILKKKVYHRQVETHGYLYFY